MPRAWDRNDDLLQLAQKYGGMGASRAKKLKRLEVENARLKRLVADLALDNRVLKDTAEGNF